MPVFYAVKHVVRSWKLLSALILGIVLASTFFAGIDIKANATAEKALDQQLENIYVDMQISTSNVNLNLTSMQSARNKVVNIEGIGDAEVISRIQWVPVKILDENSSVLEYVTIAAIADGSHVYDGWLNKPLNGIGENETYVPQDSALANLVEDGSVLQMNLSLFVPSAGYISMLWNFTVKGFAQLNDEAATIASGYQTWIMPLYGAIEYPRPSINYPLLISLENTMQKIFEAVKKLSVNYPPIDSGILIYLNRDALINPWDITTSMANVETIENEIRNTVFSDLGSVNIQNNLEWPLRSFQFVSMGIRFALTIVSLPIFFMAWYMGTTVSDVSFNLRRREIGLLSTKGFSKGQILRTFLIETFFIGLVGGLLGVCLGFLLNPIFTQFSTDNPFNLNMISPYTVIFTVVFGITLAFLSTYSSAKKAAQLPTVDALREYLPMEVEEPYRKRRYWVAFILGTYKIIVFILGINMTVELSRLVFAGGNFILIMLVGLFMVLDLMLNYIGPLLFFWGFTKIFIQGSLKFQELIAKAASFLGDLNVLATKNVRRNPARSAAVAFLVALIVGYSVQVTGQLASEQDYAVRQIYYSVGADAAVNVAYVNEASEILNNITGNVSNYIQNGTIEYYFSTTSATGISMAMKAVKSTSWLKTAYYESDWFSGTEATAALSSLASDKNTIILERSIAKSSNLKINENIPVRFGSTTKTLKIIGFFGPEPPDQQTMTISPTFGQYWSFISEELYKEISMSISASAKILLKLKSQTDGKIVAENIRNLNLNISYVESFAEKWEESQGNVITMGTLDVQRLGIVFAVLAASVGTALISTVSMKERSREAAIMSVKGLSYKQLVLMFLTENLALVMFSVILGVFVGFVIVYGNISASNAMIWDLIRRRLVFPLDSTILLTCCLTLIFASTILPILLMCRKYVTKLERMVRLR